MLKEPKPTWWEEAGHLVREMMGQMAFICAVSFQYSLVVKHFLEAQTNYIWHQPIHMRKY